MSEFHVSQVETHVRSLYENEHWHSELDERNNKMPPVLRSAHRDVYVANNFGTAVSVWSRNGWKTKQGKPRRQRQAMEGARPARRPLGQAGKAGQAGSRPRKEEPRDQGR